MHSREALGARGPLAKRIEGFAPRAGQQAMAQAVEATLADQRTLIAEAGTGTGKTYAYLVPALLSGMRVIVSTGTRNLQDQLFQRDLPLVRDALEIPVHVALLKGRSNYLCRYRLERTEAEGRFTSRAAVSELERVRTWSRRTKSGDIAEVTGIGEDAEVWPLVTSTADNCLGGACPSFNDCFVVRARRKAAEAEVVVVNHHLFFADMSVREEGFAQLLPSADAVIFDEAHQLPEIATEFFGVSFSSHQVRNLCRDTIAEDIKERSGLAELRPAAETAERATMDLRLALGTPVARLPWASVSQAAAVTEALDKLRQSLIDLCEMLETVAARGPGLSNCARRAVAVLDRLDDVTAGESINDVVWLEAGPRSFGLRRTPLDIARPFRERLRAVGTKSWVYTSATLAVGEDFSYFTSRLGLEEAETRRWESPFDYGRQALLYLPPSLPDPSTPDYTARVIDAALPILQASRGRAFLLFTSHRALKLALELLQGKTDYPLLVQGSMGRARLLEQFVEAGNAILLGTASFWEGVDVRGAALSCVIIDKLPFATPDDPVLKARAQLCTAAGGNPFVELQLPEAVIALKQGAGRLIRDVNDTGVLVVCDPRLTSKSYGRLFRESLPPMPVTRTLSDVERFFAGRAQTTSAATNA
jgi:ATP-dependent DNA helicase DinG